MAYEKFIKGIPYTYYELIMERNNVMSDKRIYDASRIAKYIVVYCFVNECYCTNIRLQMLLYLVQEEFLTKLNKPCFNDEIVAEKFGPSVPDIYSHYSSHGGFAIIPFDQPECCDKTDINEEDIVVINSVIDRAKDLDDLDLITKVRHVSPWIDVFDSQSIRVINKDLIKVKATYRDGGLI